MAGIPGTLYKYDIISWCTLPETNIAPGNGWLEYYGILVSFWETPFSGAMLVPGSVMFFVYWPSIHIHILKKDTGTTPLSFKIHQTPTPGKQQVAVTV